MIVESNPIGNFLTNEVIFFDNSTQEITRRNSQLFPSISTNLPLESPLRVDDQLKPLKVSKDASAIALGKPVPLARLL